MPAPRRLTMPHRPFITVLAVLLAHMAAAPAGAQHVTALSPAAGERPAGWSVTPALDYAFVWDSNVLFDNIGSDIVSEGLHMVKPNGVLGFRNRRTTFDVQYQGAFVQHSQLASLNSYDQRLAINAVRQLSRRSAWSLRHAATLTPTTDLVELVGVPFTRIGVHRQDLRTGVDLMLGRHTNVTAAYVFQWVDFKPTADRIQLLAGGYNHGAILSLSRSISRRAALTGEYSIHRATVVDGSGFNIQNSWAGFNYNVSETLQTFGGLGISHLTGTADIPSRSGPAVRMGVLRRTPSSEMAVSFSKAFTPSYSFGGTSDNEELTARLRVPIARRLTAAATASLRQNEPLRVGGSGFTLRTLWLNASVGYLLTDWMRLEGFSSAARQTSDQPDGRITRYQLGVQVTAATTARIR